MIEIDSDGVVIFVGGDWRDLVGFTKPAGDPLAVLAGCVDDPTALDGVVYRAQALGESTVVTCERSLVNLKVLPLPSANAAGVTHALVGLSADDDPGDPYEMPVADVDPGRAAATFGLEPQRPAPGPNDVRPPRASSPGGPTGTVDLLPAAPATGSPPSVPTSPRRPLASDADLGASQVAPMSHQPPSPQLDQLRSRRLGGLPLLDWAGGLGVVLVALFLRTRGLGDVPGGFHGDEAVTGQEARRILNGDWIGVYSGSALGQPTAPFFFTAIVTALLGEGVVPVRVASALAGTATVALLWYVLRRRFDQPTAIAGAFALATLTWALHFSRIGFGVAWWPFFVLLAAALVDRAARRDTVAAWAVAGAATAFGVYVYNSHWFAGFSIALFAAGWFAWRLRGGDPTATAKLAGAGLVGGLVVLIPMLRYIRGDNGYFNHFNLVSKREGPEWVESGLFGRISTVFGWYLDSWKVLLVEPIRDGGDASGVIGMVPALFTLLALAGVVVALLRHRSSFVVVSLVVLVLAPLGASMTRDGLTRRDYSMAPFVAVFVAIGAVALWRVIRDRFGNPAGWGVAGLLAITMLWSGVVPYFTEFREDPGQRWAFADELSVAASGINEVAGDGAVFVNWYSARHYYQYETIDYLVDQPGVSRTPLEQGYVDEPAIEPFPEVTTDQLFVLVGDYTRNLPRLIDRYPEGVVESEMRIGPPVVVFRVPG